MACAFTMTDLSLHYSEKPLLQHVNLTISDGDRIGIVGRNGAGKSTLLKVLAGLEMPDGGSLSVRRHLQVAYLQQTPDLRPEDDITQAALSCMPLQPDEDPQLLAYEVQNMLTRLGFADVHQKVSTLSGGQRMQVALCGVLSRKTDVLMLDEPTNHIDLQTSQWLQDQLVSYRGTLLVVTHDRYLLERIFNRILYVGGGEVQDYHCGYAGYLQERIQREQMQQATLRKNKSLYRKELAWIRRGAQARSTKAKGRIDRFEALTEAIKQDAPEESLTMKSVAGRLGRKIVSWQDLSVGIEGQMLCSGFSYTLLRDDRLGIVGENGAGKTTLLRTLIGDLQPMSGSIEKGETVRVGYFSQHCPVLSPQMRIIDAVRDVAVKVYTPQGDVSASQMAETFLFPSGMQYQKVSSLSGGQMRRLHLLRILMTAPNVLVLDEPTNDLDLQTLNVLQDYLDSFQGAVIAVSHDRYFLDRITTHIFAFDHGVMKPYNDGYQAWLDDIANTEADMQPAAKPVQERPAERHKGPSAPRFSFKQQRDFYTIDETMAQLQQKIEQTDAEIGRNATDYVKVSELMELQNQQKQQLQQLQERWLYLQEKWQEIQAYQSERGK